MMRCSSVEVVARDGTAGPLLLGRFVNSRAEQLITRRPVASLKSTLHGELLAETAPAAAAFPILDDIH